MTTTSQTQSHAGARMHDFEYISAFARENSEEAFKTLVERYTPLVFSTCLRWLKNHQDAEDATQAVFVILAKKAPSLKETVVLAPWLATTCKFVCANLSRKNKKLKSVVQEHGRASMLENEPENTLGQGPEIEKALSKLSTSKRNVVYLHFFMGKSQTDIARELGVTKGVINKRLKSSLVDLRQHLARLGLSVTPSSLEGFLKNQSILPLEPQLTSKAVAAALAKAGTTTSITKISKGAMHMMFMSKLKTVSLTAAGLLLIAGGSIAAWSKGFDYPEKRTPETIAKETPPPSSLEDKTLEETPPPSSLEDKTSEETNTPKTIPKNAVEVWSALGLKWKMVAEKEFGFFDPLKAVFYIENPTDKEKNIFLLMPALSYPYRGFTLKTEFDEIKRATPLPQKQRNIKDPLFGGKEVYFTEHAEKGDLMLVVPPKGFVELPLYFTSGGNRRFSKNTITKGFSSPYTYDLQMELSMGITDEVEDMTSNYAKLGLHATAYSELKLYSTFIPIKKTDNRTDPTAIKEAQKRAKGLLTQQNMNLTKLEVLLEPLMDENHLDQEMAHALFSKSIRENFRIPYGLELALAERFKNTSFVNAYVAHHIDKGHPYTQYVQQLKLKGPAIEKAIKKALQNEKHPNRKLKLALSLSSLVPHTAQDAKVASQLAGQYLKKIAEGNWEKFSAPYQNTSLQLLIEDLSLLPREDLEKLCVPHLKNQKKVSAHLEARVCDLVAATLLLHFNEMVYFRKKSSLIFDSEVIKVLKADFISGKRSFDLNQGNGGYSGRAFDLRFWYKADVEDKDEKITYLKTKLEHKD